MNNTLTGPSLLNQSPHYITVLIEDRELAEAISECTTPEAKSELVQDSAEIGIRVLERQHTDQSVQAVIRALESQRDQDRSQYEEQRRQDTERFDQQRKLDQQIRDHQRALERERYAAQLAEQKRQFEAQLETQKAFFERRAEAALKIREQEKSVYQAELRKLNDTAGNLGSDLKGDIERASILLQTFAEREQAREESDSLREQTSNYKGVAFEKGLLNDLIEFSGTRTGDHVVHTGADAADGTNRKVGDLIYTLNTHNGPVKIAIEAKDRTLKHSGREEYFINELTEARDLRGAKYGIVVASLDENCDTNARPRDPVFKDLENGNFLVIVDEGQPYSIALRTALHWIHNLEKAPPGENADARLFEHVQAGLGRIERLNDNFTQLKRLTSSLINNLGTLRGKLDDLDDELEKEVEHLQEMLN